MVTTALARRSQNTPDARQARQTAPDREQEQPAPDAPSTAAAPSTRAPATREVQTASRARAVGAGAGLESQLRAALTKQAEPDPVAQYQAQLAAYESAFGEHKKLVDDYWKNMRAARARGEFVSEQPPPKYSGPPKPVDPSAPPGTGTPPPATSTIPTKQAFVDAAAAVYGFSPDQASESEFKQAYAREALAQGLTAEQVAKVYAFETGGDGKFDLQPIRRDGTAISTALGYAQLLNANSVAMMAKHGEKFARELDAAGKPEKAAIVRRMAEDARKVPDNWDAYQAFAKTPAGRAMHAANLDVDIGPKMQMNKVKGIIDAAKAAGHAELTPAQLELLNLAGERQGLLMLKPENASLPTANFFDRAGYEANPVVHQRTAAQLLARIDELMTKNITKPGAQELLAAFAAARAS